MSDVATNLVTPKLLADATQGDPQFAIPSRPRVISSIPTAWTSFGFVIEGLGSRRVLSGASVQGVLPALLPLLDGSHDWSALARQSGLDVDGIRQILSMLFMSGLLEEGGIEAPLSPSERFVAGAGDLTRVNRTAVEASDRLRDTTVGVVTASPLSDALAEALRTEGLSVVVGDRVDTLPPSIDFVIVDPALLPPANPIDGIMIEGRTPMLPLQFDRSSAYIGPVSYRDFGPCLECSRRPGPARDRLVAAELSVVAHLVALECVLLLGRIGNARASSSAVIIDRDDMTTRLETVLPRAACAVCGSGIESAQDHAAYRYEQSVAFPPRHLVDPRRNQTHYEAKTVKLTLEFREFPAAEDTPLPPRSQSLEPRPDVGSLDAHALGGVLAAAFGLMPGTRLDGAKLRRWAPTGGNLGSPQGYVECRSVVGIPDGIYAYHAPTHSLKRVAEEQSDQFEMNEHREGGVVEVLFTAELSRVMKKYSTFGFRVAHLDAGVAMLHAVLSADQAGIGVMVLPAWDDTRLAAKYRLDLREQPITAVLALRRDQNV